MAMRIDVSFPRPLDSAQRTQVLLAIACLGKSSAVRFPRGGYGCIILGEAMSRASVASALAEVGLTPSALRSSLDDSEDTVLDEPRLAAGAPAAPERVRPIGR